MQYKANTPEEYLELISPTRRGEIIALINAVEDNLPKGFEKEFQYGMITFVVPLSIYEKGYHAKANTALPFISIALQKHTLNIYHNGIYADSKLLMWFNQRYHELFEKKPNMGKSCIRFKTVDEKVVQILSELAQKMTVDEYIKLYEERLR